MAGAFAGSILTLREALNATSPIEDLPSLEDDTVSWQAALWPLIALALNAMLQRSPSDHFPSHEPFSTARSSVVICLADTIIFILWLSYGLFSGIGLRESARIYREELGIYDKGENILLFGTPAIGLILFALIPMPQCLKVYGMSGVPVTQFLATVFLLAYATSVVANTFGVPHTAKASNKTKTRSLHTMSRERRDKLNSISYLLYCLALLVQVVLWLVIAVVVFKDVLLSNITSEENSFVEGTSKLVYGCIIVTFYLGGLYLVAYKGIGILLIIGGIIFVKKVSSDSFHTWYSKMASSYVMAITTIVCLLVGAAIVVGGVLVMSFVDFLFKWTGEIISGPTHVEHKTKHISSTNNGVITPHIQNGHDTHNTETVAVPHTATSQANEETAAETRQSIPGSLELSRLTQPALAHILPTHAEDTALELEDIHWPLLLRRAISINYPPTRSDLTQTPKRPSISLEAGLPFPSETHRSSTDATRAGEGTQSPQSHHAAHTTIQVVRVRHGVMKYLGERGIAVGFAITNLIFAILYYRCLYSSEGTRKAFWTEVVG